MLTQTALMWYGTILFLSGLGFFTLIYLTFRRWIRGRVVCFVYNKNRQIHISRVRPDDLKILHIGGHAYYYKEDLVTMTPISAFFGLFKQYLPSLVFEEDAGAPINLYTIQTPKVGKDNVSSGELSKILNDKTVQDFVNAQSKIKLNQVVQAIMVGILVSVVTTGGAAWYIIRAINSGRGMP